jgi:hypothetical protein
MLRTIDLNFEIKNGANKAYPYGTEFEKQNLPGVNDAVVSVGNYKVAGLGG